jgi:TonB family protein
MARSNNRLFLGLSTTVTAVAVAGFAFAAGLAPKVDTSQPTNVIYPKASQAKGEEGTVYLKVYVTPAGRATRVAVFKSSGYNDLDDAAVETAANWHYVPAVHDGDTTSDWATVKVVYQLPTTASSK